MKFQFINKLKALVFDTLTGQSNLVHFITTREGGFSKPPYDTLNLSFNTEDDPLCVSNNRKRIANTLGIAVGQLIFPRQVHGDTVIRIDGSYCQRITNNPIEADALITSTPMLGIGILIADCVPLLFYDPVHQAIGVAHAGWRGTVANIALKTITAMKKQFGTHPGDLIAGIGPSIGPQHFEIGDVVAEEFKNAFQNYEDILLYKKNKTYCNLWHANQKQLIEAGINKQNISIAEICTYKHHDIFYSHRFSGGKTGRMACIAMLR